MAVVMDQVPAFADLVPSPQERVLWRITGYYNGAPLHDLVQVGSYRDDISGVRIVSALVVCDSRDEAIQVAAARGWVSPLIEVFRLETRDEPRGDDDL